MQTFRLTLLVAVVLTEGTQCVSAVEVVRPLVPFSLIAPTGSTNRLQLTLRETQTIFRLSDTETTSVTGSLTGNIRTDVVGNSVEVTGLEFSGGQFALSNVNFNISIIFVGNITASTSNLQGTINTIPRFGDVVDGQFNTNEHAITVNNGTIAVGGSLVTPTSVNLAQSPLTLTADSTGTVVLTELGMTGRIRDYRARITIPVNVTEPIEGQPAEITAIGNIVADGFFSIDFAIPGDFNGDDRVDAADYTVWRDNLGGGETTLAMGSGSGNATVDADDYALWRSHFGSTSSASVATSPDAVPEPSAALAFGLAMASLGWFRRRRRVPPSSRFVAAVRRSGCELGSAQISLTV